MDISSLRERGNIGTFTVSELNGYIKNLLEGNRTLGSVTVSGEISNFVCHSSGHLYFSLKDEGGQIRAVMFRSYTSGLKFKPESGMKVIVHGSVSVFARDGSYQLYASTMQPDGIGALYLAYEQLREKLSTEGLFDSGHKEPIPEYPTRIGVITSPTGAAVRDIINVTGRRYPLADIYVYPAIVQGERSVATLISGIEYFEKSGLVDVIIIGRGGGSIEDLWSFNSEALARKIYSCDIPVISAVGHETDFTICDFVADLRAPTPSAAAELAVPDIKELYIRLDNISARCTAALERQIDRSRDRLDRLNVDNVYSALRSGIDARLDNLERLYERAKQSISHILEAKRAEFSVLVEKANAMNPLAVLSRGYSIVEHENVVISSTDAVKIGEGIKVTVSDGVIDATVQGISREKLK